jgi:hypothetical protein
MNRLGYMGIQEVKEHPWIKNFPWDDLKEKRIEAPYLPKYTDNFDKKYCEAPDKIGNETQERYQSLYRRDNFIEIFNEYTYYDEEEKEKLIQVSTNRKHSNSNSLLNQPAYVKKIKHNKYSASIDVSSSMKTINADRISNNLYNTKLNNFRHTIRKNECDVFTNRNDIRLHGVHGEIPSSFKTPNPSSSKKTVDKLPLIINPSSLNNSKSKEKFFPSNSIHKLKLNPNNFVSIKSFQYGTISSSSTGSSVVSLNTLRKKSK